MSFVHQPYASQRKPFSIGLAPLAPERWFEPTERLAAELAQKERLFADARDAVFLARGDTQAAQQETLDALVDFLVANHPGVWRREGEDIAILPAGRRVPLQGEPPLLVASRLVQDDLCLMRREADGWRLVAASLCFPSSWSLSEKFDRPMDRIHATVPGFNGTMGDRVARIFDHLRPGAPVFRLNWSIYDDDELRHARSKTGPRRWEGPDVPFAENAFVRVERQSLSRLPVCGDILFTIQVFVDPVEGFRRHPDGARLAAGLRDQLAQLDAGQLEYKGMTAHRDRLVAGLDALAREAASA